MGVLSLIAGLFGVLPSPGLKTYLTVAAITILALTALTGYVKGRAGEGEAIAKNNLEWTTKLTQRERELNDEIHKAVTARDTIGDGDDDLDRLCQRSPTCRDNRR